MRHEYFDGRGTVKIYATLANCTFPGCSCHNHAADSAYRVTIDGDITDAAGNRLLGNDGEVIQIDDGRYRLDKDGYLTDKDGRKIEDKHGNLIRPKRERSDDSMNDDEDDGMTPEEAGKRIAQYAQRIAKTENVPLHAAQALAIQRHARLGELYLNGLPVHARYRGGHHG